MTGKERRVSIVVLNWRGEDDTVRCVESIRSQRCDATIEIIIVDNDSTPKSRADLESIQGCRLVATRRNLGFAGGMNAGAAVASGEIIGLLNNDLVLAGDWVQRGLDFFDANPEVGMLGGVSFRWDDTNPLYCEDNALWSVPIVDPQSGSGSLDCHFVSVSEVSSLDGSNLFIRHALWQRVGGFDSDYFAYGEDVDLSARCTATGSRLVYEPAMRTWHRRNASSDRVRIRREYWSRRNHIYNVAKHFPETEWRGRARQLSIGYIWFGVSGHASGMRGRMPSNRLGLQARLGCFWAGLWGCTHGPRLTRKRREVIVQGLHDPLWTEKLRRRNPPGEAVGTFDAKESG